MADQTVTYQVNAEGNLTGEAKKAAEALATLEQELSDSTKELAAMQKALKNLEKATSPNKDQTAALTTKINASKEAIAKMQSEHLKLGGTFRKTGAATKNTGQGFKELAAKASAMPGPIGSLVSKLISLKDLLGKGAMAAGAAALAAGLTAVAYAAVKAAKSIYDYGISAADAARSELLQLEGLTKMRFLFQRTAGNATEMQNAIDDIAAKTPTARGELVKYTDELYRMGLRGTALTKTLEGVSIKHAAQGAAAAHAFGSWAAGVNMAGGSVDKLVGRVKGQLGGIAQQQMKSLTVQTEKQKEAFDMLFTGVKMEKYLDAWKEVKDLMSQTTESGKALKFLMTTVLQPLIDSSASGAGIVKRFFQVLIIGALEVTIAVLKVRRWFRETFGDKSQFKGLWEGEGASKALKVALGGLIGVVVALTGVMTYMALQIGMFVIPILWGLAAPFLPFILAAAAVGIAVATLIVYWDELVQAFEDLDWIQAGADIVTGLLKGLIPGPIVDGMRELAGTAIDAFKKAIGSASPAKAFIQVGTTIPEGVAEGVDAGAPAAQAATANMLDGAAPRLGPHAAPADSAPRSSAANGGKPGGAPVTIGEIHVHATSDKPEQMAIDFRRELERVLAGFASELGAPEPA
jgi:Skp family chaperone for outer membrane proteins